MRKAFLELLEWRATGVLSEHLADPEFKAHRGRLDCQDFPDSQAYQALRALVERVDQQAYQAYQGDQVCQAVTDWLAFQAQMEERVALVHWDLVDLKEIRDRRVCVDFLEDVVHLDRLEKRVNEEVLVMMAAMAIKDVLDIQECEVLTEVKAQTESRAAQAQMEMKVTTEKREKKEKRVLGDHLVLMALEGFLGLQGSLETKVQTGLLDRTVTKESLEKVEREDVEEPGVHAVFKEK